MPYEPKEKDHGNPAGGREYYLEEDVIRAAEAYLDRVEDEFDLVEDDELSAVERAYREKISEYKIAEEILEDQNISSDFPIDALVGAFDGEGKMNKLTTFICASMYQREGDKMVVDYETDEPLEGIGFRVPEEKHILLNTDVQGKACELPYGTVENRASVKSFAEKNSGVAYNLGKVSRRFAVRNKAVSVNGNEAAEMGENNTGLLVNYGSVKELGTINMGVILNFGEVELLGEKNNGIIVDAGETESYGESIGGSLIRPMEKDSEKESLVSLDEAEEFGDVDTFTVSLLDLFRPSREDEELRSIAEAVEIERDLDGSINMAFDADLLGTSLEEI